jgi:DNA-binding IscR family transcriptional regulator
LKWKLDDSHLSSRLRDQLALQAMVNIARAHDQQSDLVPSLEGLANYQQVPLEALARMLDALQREGLILSTDQNPPQYLPGSSLQHIRVIDILRCARAAEDKEQTVNTRSDAVVAVLLQEVDQHLESHLGARSLADVLNSPVDDRNHEDSLV